MELAIVAIIGVLMVFGFIKMETERTSTANQKYADHPELRTAILQKKIWIGMTEDQLIDSWGSPTKRTLRQLKTKYKETLSFGTYQSAYLENGRVTGWRLPSGTIRSPPDLKPLPAPGQMKLGAGYEKAVEIKAAMQKYQDILNEFAAALKPGEDSGEHSFSVPKPENDIEREALQRVMAIWEKSFSSIRVDGGSQQPQQAAD